LWNKIEHRLFSFMSKNWRGRPLLTHAIIVNLIGNTTTATGLRVLCMLDSRMYPRASLLVPDKFHDDWSYTITPGTR